MHSSVHSGTVASINRRMDKEDVVHVYSGLLLNYKEGCPIAAAWTDLEITMLNEVRQRKTPYDITYMWNLTK